MKGLSIPARAGIALAAFLVLVAAVHALTGEDFYLWAKAFHVVAVISWMAAMLYLPRLFVYHAEAAPGSPQSEMLKVMEQRLLRVIMTPAMLVSWVFGLYLAWEGFRFSGGWLHAKLLGVVLLSGMHGYLAAAARRFHADRNARPARHWRMINEVPTVLMIVVVVLVVVKPF